MSLTFVVGVFVIAAFLLVPLGILVAFALMREPGSPAVAVPDEPGRFPAEAEVRRLWGRRDGAA